jgi:UDPglucose--hexose-1-phosphate uridylyltransferase
VSDDTPHRRMNLLTGDWVLVSPHRMGRPWQGEDTPAAKVTGASHDPDCYLCPRNSRVGGNPNPDYIGVWVFDNDFPALLAPQAPVDGADSDPLLPQAAENGICRVICYSPDHSRTMALMDRAELTAIVEAWTSQWIELSARPEIGAVTIFENRGAMMGASNPHPHGQIWATGAVPDELAEETQRQSDWYARHGAPMLGQYLQRELAADQRVIWSNDSFVIVVPWWAVWPFETLVLPRRPVAALDELTPAEAAGLAEALGQLTRLYDRVFNAPFPYSMGLHQRPTRAPAAGFVFHLHFYPPLLRSASVRKHMVGFEMLGMAQRDLTPEAAATRLKACSDAVAGW